MSLLANSDGRQAPLVVVVPFTFADINTTVFTPAFDLPADAIVTGGALIITDATDIANIEVGDAVDPDSLLAATAGQTPAKTALAGADLAAPAGATKRYGFTASITLTQGGGTLYVEYVRGGRTQVTHG